MQNSNNKDMEEGKSSNMKIFGYGYRTDTLLNITNITPTYKLYRIYCISLYNEVYYRQILICNDLI